MRRLSFLILGLAASLPGFAAITQSHGYAQFGTLKYPANFQHFDWTNPDAPKGGTLRLMASGSFDTLNPYTLKGTSPIGTGDFLQYGVNELNEPLMVGTGLYDPSGDEAASSYGLIAKSVEYAENRSWVVFNLRPEARFHDGRPITASDVAFSYRTLVKQGHPMYRTYLQEVKRVDILNPHRVRFVLRRSGNPLLILRLGELPVLPQHYWKDRDFRATTFTPPLGSGPYRVVEVDPGRRLVFERVKDWWGGKVAGKPRQVQLRPGRGGFLPGQRSRLRSLQGRRVRFLYRAPGEELAEQLPLSRRPARRSDPHGNPAPDTQPDPGAVHEHPPRRIQGTRAAPGAGRDVRLRMDQPRPLQQFLPALAQLLPEQRIRARGVPEGQEWLYLSPYRKQLPAQLFKQPFSLPTTEGRGIPRETLRHALGLLAEAGWKLSGDRLLNKKGEPLRFEILLVNPSLERILQPYRENLASIGIDARLRTVDRAQYKQRLDQFDYDMILMTLPQTLSPGLEQWQYFHSSQAKVKGSKNYAGIANPVVDAMLNRLLGAHSRDEQVAAARALDRTLLWQYYSIPNWYLNSHRLAYRNRFAFVTTPPYTLGLRAWWQKNLETSR